MKIRTKQKIIDFIVKNGPSTVERISSHFNVSRQIIHRHLVDLVKERLLIKQGRPPKVFYSAQNNRDVENESAIPERLKRIIDQNYLIITPSGEQKIGVNGFIYWCKKQNLPIVKTAEEYLRTLKKYALYKKGGLINGMYKLKHTFDKAYLDKIFYLDFYSIERFGKTKLGQMLLYAKQSQDKNLIKELTVYVKPRVDSLIKKFSIDAVSFIPPTVRREIQFMKELEKQLNLSVPSISLIKVKTPVIVPQKTLTRLTDRVENAKNTIIVNDRRAFNTILLIDDALGSGSTLNETAQKIKRQNIAKKVLGLAITGSFSGFEIISEV